MKNKMGNELAYEFSSSSSDTEKESEKMDISNTAIGFLEREKTKL